jgi:hypothetical protein
MGIYDYRHAKKDVFRDIINAKYGGTNLSEESQRILEEVKRRLNDTRPRKVIFR